MGNKLYVQVVLIITSITIVVTYIQPSFADIASVQDDIARYESTVSRAAELNAALQELVAVEQSLSRQERESLETYVPTDIDDVLIMRDIQNMFKQIDLPITTLSSLASGGFQSDVVNVDPRSREVAAANMSTLMFKDFGLSFYGRYEHLRLIVQALEVNAYPLEIIELDFAAAEDPEDLADDVGLEPGYMKYNLTLRAYALPSNTNAL